MGPNYTPVAIRSLELGQHLLHCSLLTCKPPRECCVQFCSGNNILAGVSDTCSALRDEEGQKGWGQGREGDLGEGYRSGKSLRTPGPLDRQEENRRRILISAESTPKAH